MGTFFFRWRCFQAEQRRIMNRWKRRKVSDPTAEPEWQLFEDLHHAQAEMVARHGKTQGATKHKQ